MSEVNSNGMKQLLGYLINMKPEPLELREWVEVWLDAWCPKPTSEERMVRINKLVGKLEDLFNRDAAWGEVRALLIGALVAAEATGAAAGHALAEAEQSALSSAQGEGWDSWATAVLDASGFEWACAWFSAHGKPTYLCSVSLADGTELVGRSEESKAGSRISAAKQLYDEDSSDYPPPPKAEGKP